MMLRIKDQNRVPHGGAFIYRHPISGAEFRHHTIPHLFDQVHKHCLANGYEFSGQEFTENICANAYPGTCEEVDDTGMPPMIERVKSVTKAVVSWGRSGFKMSGDELINFRLGICQACPYWQGEAGGSYRTGLCKRCGCSGVKLALPHSTCPDGKW